MNISLIRTELEKIVGSDRSFVDSQTLSDYSADMTENQPSRPDIVVKVNSLEEVQNIVKIANRFKVPLTPIVAGTNVGGLAIPLKGGIVVDLKGMNRILEINEPDMYATIEPGVSFGQLKETLDQNYPDLIFGYPLAPPQVSVLCNCLMDGLCNLSYRYGTTSEWITSLEAVLPTGEIVRTGSAALSAYPFSRAPLPDLTGLFVGWQGTTGIVTKVSVLLWPKPALRRRFFLLFYDLSNALEAIRSLSRKLVCDDLAGLSWPIGKMIFGIEKPTEKDPGEPAMFAYIDFSANDQAELKAKEQIIRADILRMKAQFKLEGPIDVDDLIKINPDFSKLSKFPMTLDFLLDHSGGGLTWVGSYGPTSNWSEAAKSGEQILSAANLPPTVVVRSMKGGHFGVLRFIITFNKSDSTEIELVRHTNAKLCESLLQFGFIPYKAPVWAVRQFLDRLDPGFLKLLRQVKATLDPNRIMNPGRWLL